MNIIRMDIGVGGIATLRIDMADRPVNLIDARFLEELAQCVELVATNTEVRGALITSAKPNGFVAGADVKDFLRRAEAGITASEGAELVRRIAAVFRRLETCGKPFAAAINGLALGGGLELALACHHRVLSQDAKAVVGLPEVKLGLLPGAGGTQRLPRLIGIERALPLLTEGRTVSPEEALALGIVDQLAAPDAVEAAAHAWLTKASQAQAPWDRKGFQVPGGSGPLAMPARDLFSNGVAGALRLGGAQQHATLAILSCVYEGTITGFDAGMRVESKYFGKCLASPQARELLQAFVGRRAA